MELLVFNSVSDYIHIEWAEQMQDIDRRRLIQVPTLYLFRLGDEHLYGRSAYN